jgi:hypothetical protein
MPKKCLYCASEIKSGRSDRRYCNVQCRTSYHNKQYEKNTTSIKYVNNILRKNHKILRQLNPNGQTTIRKTVLLDLGYSFNYFTNIFKTKSGRLYYFCYDLGIVETQNDKIHIVYWQEYMTLYRIPISK